MRTRLRSRQALLGQVAALDRAQAVIEFNLDGTVLDANANFLRLFGYQRDEVLGKHHSLFVDPAEHDSRGYADFWRRLRGGMHEEGLFRRLTSDGREVWIQGSYSPVLDWRGRPRTVIKHATDVTAQRLQYADMEGQLRAIDRAQAVISFDLDGMVLDANDNMLSALGYARDEVLGKHHSMFVAPEEREGDAYRQFWEQLRKGEYNSALFRRMRKDGSDVWIQATYNPIMDMAGRPFKVVKYATDVTAQTHASQFLRTSLESLTNTVPAIASDAQSTHDLTNQASASADAGSTRMIELVQAINGINDQARNMEEIVGLLNSIAFQTNLLSLNAAVEAAHAGDSGRGFGVVAQEVRALAMRSAQSAREIGALIRHVTDALSACTSSAQQAGEAMQAIQQVTDQVTARVRHIANSADAQTNSLRQVSQTLATLRLDGGKQAAAA